MMLTHSINKETVQNLIEIIKSPDDEARVQMEAAGNYDNYLNNTQNPNEKYDRDVVKYDLDIVENI